jgi:hypothetical protein
MKLQLICTYLIYSFIVLKHLNMYVYISNYDDCVPLVHVRNRGMVILLWDKMKQFSRALLYIYKTVLTSSVCVYPLLSIVESYVRYVHNC